MVVPSVPNVRYHVDGRRDATLTGLCRCPNVPACFIIGHRKSVSCGTAKFPKIRVLQGRLAGWLWVMGDGSWVPG